jgi:alpha-glucosidase (family GH31 glycosyl hydrolase)
VLRGGRQRTRFTRPLWLTLATGCAALALADGAPAQTIRSDGLTARIRVPSWHLRFVQPGEGIELSEARATGPGPSGRLGFRAAGRWRHATRFLSVEGGAGIGARLATTDPAGRALAVRVRADGEGAIRVTARVVGGSTADVEAVGIGFDAAPGERYLGFGERSNAVDQRGNTVENYVGEGPYLPGEAALVSSIVPPWSIHDRADATYFPMPWLLSTRGYGVLLDNTETSHFRLGSDRRRTWSMQAETSRLAFRVLAGPRPADVLRRLTERTGRQPKPMAPWFLGPWFQTGQPSKVPPQDERRWARLLRDGDAPVSVAETHMRYLPCGSQQGNDDFERRRTHFFHSQGFAILTYFQEKVCVDYLRAYRDGLRRRAFLLNRAGNVYEFDAFVGDRSPPRTLMAQIDFTAPGAQGLYDSLLGEAVSHGHDGWMEDFGEAIPLDSVAANGMGGERFHNLYPVPYHRAGYRFAARQDKPIARFVRSGWTGVHPYAQIVWGGDPTTGWGFDGLASSVRNGLTMGLSGIGIWGSDIGGYFTLPGAPRLTPELLVRWIQFGAVSGVMRTKATGQAIPDYRRPQIWEPGIRPHWRRYAKLRTQLYPYLAAAEAAYRHTGLPLMRHLALPFPGDRVASGLEDQFMFGPDLMAAPVLAPRRRDRRVYLPAGRWIDFWRAVRYGRERGDFRLVRARVLSGRRRVRVPAPLAELPLFVRAGALFALLSPDVDTLAGYGRRKGLMHLRDRRDRLRLLLFPRGRSSRAFNYGERLHSVEGAGSWRLTVAGRRTRSYSVEASLNTLRQPFRPRAVRLDGAVLPRAAWSFEGRSGVLRARFRARRAVLEVEGAPPASVTG